MNAFRDISGAGEAADEAGKAVAPRPWALTRDTEKDKSSKDSEEEKGKIV